MGLVPYLPYGHLPQHSKNVQLKVKLVWPDATEWHGPRTVSVFYTDMLGKEVCPGHVTFAEACCIAYINL